MDNKHGQKNFQERQFHSHDFDNLSSKVYNPKLGVEGDSDSGFLRCMAKPTPAVYGEVRLSVHGEVEGSDQSD